MNMDELHLPFVFWLDGDAPADLTMMAEPVVIRSWLHDGLADGRRMELRRAAATADDVHV